MAEIFEMLMVVSFGASWPMSIYKSFTSRTCGGKSISFLFLIMFGYVCGIVYKLLSGNLTYVFFFYALNLCLVAIDAVLYFRNKRLDKLREREKKEEFVAETE